MALVSIVVSAYNRPEMLRAAIASVLSQTFSDFEMIVQDDSTTIDCETLVRGLDDDRIQYTRNSPPLGTLANLRAGYRKCTGKYIATLNDDDLYGPGYLATMVEALETNPQCCLAFCDHFIMDDEGQIDPSRTEENSRRFGRDSLSPGVLPQPLVAALLTKVVPGMFALYRRSLMDFNDFPDEVSSGYDFWLTYLAVRTGLPVFYVPDRLTFYRVHAGSQTSSFSDPAKRLRSLAYDLFTHRRFLADEKLREIHPAIKAHLAETHTSTGAALLRLGRRGEAMREFAASFRMHPRPGPLLGLGLMLLPSAQARRILDSRSTPAG